MIGTRLRQRYKIIQQLEGGGIGETYIAEDLDIPANPKPKCIVKRLKPQAMHPDIVRLFQKEGEILYKLGNNHDAIPKLYAYFEENREFYLIQELINGHDLSKEITPGKQWREGEVMKFLKEILEVLAFVHQNNVIHRDIKPSNIVRCRYDGKLMLIDFGAVKEIGTLVMNATGQTSYTVAVGTSGYMPSEQEYGHPKFSSDIYAVGMTAIQALTGMLPHLIPKDPDTLEVIWRYRASVTDWLAEILTKMVRYDFRQRYVDAAEVLQVLAQPIAPLTPLTFAPAKTLQIGDQYGYINQTDWGVIQSQLDEPGNFSEGLAVVEIGGKYGYIDRRGRVAIQPQFDDAWEFSEGLAVVEIGGKYGYIDRRGWVAIQHQFDDAWEFSEGLAAVEIGGKYGYIDQRGGLVIQPQFDDAWEFSEGLAVVWIGDKCGYINKTGRMVIQPRFLSACSFSQGRASVKVLRLFFEHWRTIDKTGKFID